MNKVKLLRELVNSGLKIFSLKDAREMAIKIGLNEKSVTKILYHLKKDGWIEPIKNGVYSITSESGFGPHPHDFEVAMAIVNPCAISHWTALHYHHLTQQTPNIIYAITPIGSTIPNKKKSIFHFVRLKKDRYFGIQNVWMGEAKVQITDPERTLLDGLLHPQYCGDFNEVLHAFKVCGSGLDLDKIVTYSKKLGVATVKRLGFILESLGVDNKWLKTLEEVPVNGIRKLDPSGSTKGTKSKRWKIIENIGGES